MALTKEEQALAETNKKRQQETRKVTDFESVFRAADGPTEEVVRYLSEEKDEPKWMLDFRLDALKKFLSKPMPNFGPNLDEINFDNISYYVKPVEEDQKNQRTWNDVPEKMKETYDRLGVPRAEAEMLAGVSNQWDSEVVFHELQEDLKKQGVIFTDMDSGLREDEETVRKYFGTIIPSADNKFAALNSAFWSGGSYVWVPPGVKVDRALQTYFRINSKAMLQAERTLIIASEGAQVNYVEGCSASSYSAVDSIHAAVVELVAHPGAEINYFTAQNWDTENVWNMVTKRAAAYQNSTVRWIQGELGSKTNLKYPSVYLLGEGAHAEILSVAFAGKGQNQDTGGKAVHVASNTTSQIISKSISSEGGVASYRGLLEIADGAENCRSRVVCDALLLDDKSVSNTWPTIRIGDPSADVGHEATVSKVGDEQLFYLMSRGISEEEASAMIVNGFIEPIIKEMPMEYAVEINRMIQIQMEGSIG
jgi:Fe-S cluster assembly protein SufB